MEKTTKTGVYSEIGKLHTVLVNRPGLALKRLTPGNKDKLLFNDILWVARAQEEHDNFVSLMQQQEIEVLELKDLMTDSLSNPAGRTWVLDKLVDGGRFGSSLIPPLREFLEDRDDNELAEILLGGITAGEVRLSSPGLSYETLEETDFILPPLPNHLFTRDTSFWVGNGVSVNPMATPARRHEALNLELIYRFHRRFAESTGAIWFGHDAGGEKATLEGGDVMVITPDTLLVGLSERTTPAAVESLAESVFKQGEFSEILVAQLPKTRSYMHLDTVMCMMSRDTWVIYPDVVRHMPSWTLRPGDSGKIRFEKENNFLSRLGQVLGVDKLNLIETGGDKYESQREQWDDGNNVLALSPGKVIAYERNVETNRRFRDAGIEVLTIPGSELSRGQGGPHCMSCPILREALA